MMESEAFFFMKNDIPEMSSPRFRITNDENERCMEFAREKARTTGYYELRGQSPNIKQEYDGQAGNLVLGKYLKVPIDFRVHQLSDKSFAADAGIHDCKTCSRESARNYNQGRPSWTFQFSDVKGTKKSVDPVQRFVYLVLEVAKQEYEIRWLLSPQQIKNIWTPPDKESLRNFKRVVREQHIPSECRVWR